jgi:hypothetical protein
MACHQRNPSLHWTAKMRAAGGEAPSGSFTLNLHLPPRNGIVISVCSLLFNPQGSVLTMDLPRRTQSSSTPPPSYGAIPSHNGWSYNWPTPRPLPYAPHYVAPGPFPLRLPLIPHPAPSPPQDGNSKVTSPGLIACLVNISILLGEIVFISDALA